MKKFIFLLTSLFLLSIIFWRCGKDEVEPEPVPGPSLQAWATPESVAYKGSSTVMLKAENAKVAQIGTAAIIDPIGTISVSYYNLLKDTSIICSVTGYNGQLVYTTVLIKVATPIKTKLDTMTNYLCLAPWRTMKVESQEPDGSWIGLGMSDLEARELWSFTQDGNSKVYDPLAPSGTPPVNHVWHIIEDLKHLFYGGRTDSLEVLTEQKLVLSYRIINGPMGRKTFVH